MFELEQLGDLFEFNRPFEECVNNWELNQLWSNINKCKKEYLTTKDHSLLFLIDFYLSQLLNLDNQQKKVDFDDQNETTIRTVNTINQQLSQQSSYQSSNYQSTNKEKLVADLFDDLFMNSYDLPKNQWILIILMKRFNLSVTDKIEKKINLYLTLNECSSNYETNKLIKYIENPKDVDENKFLLKLRRLLNENPHLGKIQF